MFVEFTFSRGFESYLFEPFFTTEPVGKGTGLGLARVYSIVKQSGGFIFAERELGKGTTFKVYLPQVDQEEATVPARTSPTEAGQWSLETPLLVEDEPAFRELLREGLEANATKYWSVKTAWTRCTLPSSIQGQSACWSLM